MSSDKKEKDKEKDTADLQRRSMLKTSAAATLGLGALNAISGPEAHAEEIIQPRSPAPEHGNMFRTGSFL